MKKISQLVVKCLLRVPANVITDRVALRLINWMLPSLVKSNSTDIISLITRLGWKIKVLPCSDLDVLSLRCMVVLGKFDRPLLSLMSCFVNEGDNVIDIGANEGYVSLHFANKVGPKGQVFSIEPHPLNVEVLRENILINKLTNVTVIAKAVSDNTQKESLMFSGSGAWGTLIECHVNKDNQITVDVENLDDIALNFPKISLIKMDVEGNELRVIRGAKK